MQVVNCFLFQYPEDLELWDKITLGFLHWARVEICTVRAWVALGWRLKRPIDTLMQDTQSVLDTLASMIGRSSESWEKLENSVMPPRRQSLDIHIFQ